MGVCWENLPLIKNLRKRKHEDREKDKKREEEREKDKKREETLVQVFG